MPASTDPLLTPVSIDDLRPTQMTVGYREVERKRKAWQEQRDAGEFLGQHMLPAVLGPDGNPWIIDNHHLARALHDAGVERVLVRPVADLHKLPKRLFRSVMDNRNWLHPYNQHGRRRPIKAIPKHIGDLADDPYRSLAGELRRVGGYAKVDAPFAEFLWADFLRSQIADALVRDDFDKAVEEAIGVAKGKRANYLPGWAGREG